MHRTGPDAVQQAAVLALGCCNPGCMSVLLEEMQGMNEDFSAERAKVCSTSIAFTGRINADLIVSPCEQKPCNSSLRLPHCRSGK